jgi:glycosyltransferase involved in cell wall biosynthesis
MRIYTCTPVAFDGGADFFTRDSGLLCRGLQSIGIESRAVMPNPGGKTDETDLIRTDAKNLESVAWWRDRQLDAVVLYAWGRPKFRHVARAIRQAGIFLILNQDNGGLVSPLAGFRGWMAEQRKLSGGGWPCWKQIAKGLSYGLLVTDPLRAMHLNYGDVIACVSPRAGEHYRKLCRIYGGRRLVDRVRILPHAVEPRFRFSRKSKKRQVVCVGRWDDRIQKRPERMTEVVGQLIADDRALKVVIFGNAVDELVRWHAGLIADDRERIELRGRVDRDELAEILADSQVFYSPSSYESFGIAAAEALCSGCSVVAQHSVSMSAFEWFVSESSGRLAETETLGSHLAALQAELDDWGTGRRNPSAISAVWCTRLHADHVARQVVEMVVDEVPHRRPLGFGGQASEKGEDKFQVFSVQRRGMTEK